MMANARRIKFRRFFEEGKYATWDWKEREQLRAMHIAAYGNKAAADKFINELVCRQQEAKHGTS